MNSAVDSRGDHRPVHESGPQDAHGVREVVVNGISSLDEPSVEWGWHQHSRKVGWLVGLPFAVFLLLMVVGNHEGNVENYFLVGSAIAVMVSMLLFLRPRKDHTAEKNRVYEVPEGHYSTNPR